MTEAPCNCPGCTRRRKRAEERRKENEAQPGVFSFAAYLARYADGMTEQEFDQIAKSQREAKIGKQP